MEVHTVVIFVFSVLNLSMKTTEGKNMTTNAFSTCGKETYKSMSNPITCSAGYCHSLLIGHTSPSHIFNTNCRNQCSGCFKAILKMLKYKEKLMATTTTPKTVTNAMTGQPLNKALSTTRPIIKATTIQSLIRAMTAQPVISARTTTTQPVNTIQQATGTNPTSPTTWNHLIIVVIVLVVVILAIIATVIICIFRKNTIARCKACRSSERHSSTSRNPSSKKHTSGNSSNQEETRKEGGRLEESEISVPLLEKPTDISHQRVYTNGEIQKVTNDARPITPNHMESLMTPNGTCLETAPSSLSSQIAFSAPMASNDTAPQAAPQTANGAAAPLTAPNGAVLQTAQLAGPPQAAPNGAVPQIRSGASPQAGPIGPLPGIVHNGVPPQVATNGNNVYQAVGSGGNLFHTTANKITNIYITNEPNSLQHHGNNQSPVQQNNEDLPHSVPEEGEKTKPNQTSDGEGSHKLTFIEK